MISSQKIPCSALSQVAHPVAEAFRSDRYIFECSTSFDKGRTGYIAQAFGVIQRVGVLYLQIGSGMESVSDEHVVKRFQLLRKALMDTVNVK